MVRSYARRKKRHYQGINCYDKAQKTQCQSTVIPQGPNSFTTIASAKKIIARKNPELVYNDFNFIMNFELLHLMILEVMKCPSCFSSIFLQHCPKKRMGLCLTLELCCTSCDWCHSFQTSRPISNLFTNSVGKDSYEINVLSALAFREISEGYEPMKLYHQLMNIPSITYNTYDKINKKLYNASETVAQQVTNKAALETRNLINNNASHDDTIQCQVSVDGTWQKRGHSSFNGVVTAISTLTGKCIDAVVLSKHCKGCIIWKSKKGTPEYEDWKAYHKCLANHQRSSGAMEGAGAITIFHRYVEKYKLQYTSYLGDGDTSSYSAVLASCLYKDIEIKKAECIGHIQKKIGSHGRALRQRLRGKKLCDGKPVAGKGRLTDKALNLLQNYFGMAIRQNLANIYQMKKAVWAVLFHNSDIKDMSIHHQFCPRTIASWCKWQRDHISGHKTYKPKLSLPLAIKSILVPVFKDLRTT